MIVDSKVVQLTVNEALLCVHEHYEKSLEHDMNLKNTRVKACLVIKRHLLCYLYTP